LWAFWTQILGRSSDEFWELTPREIQACSEAWARVERAQNIRAGTIAASVYNVHQGRGKKPLKWSDFFTDTEAKPKQPQSAEAILAGFEAASKTLEIVKSQRGG